MKKRLMLLLLFACSLVAKAQFANPFEYNNGKGLYYQIRVMTRAVNGSFAILPEDTIAETNEIGIVSAGTYSGKEIQDGDSICYTINAQIKDYYRRDMGNISDFGITMSFVNSGEFHSPINWAATEIGGHYNWEWKDPIENVGQKGHIQMNMKPTSKVYGKNGYAETPLKEYCQLDIYSYINTGFPYDIANYQGVTKYSVYAPDSSLICTKEIAMRMSADSTMNGQVQQDLICSVDSASKGSYRVIMDGPYLEKPSTWLIEVVDPLEGASTLNPVDATYRLKEPDFKNEGKGKGWKCNGKINPTYFNEVIDNKQHSAMVVRTQKYEGNGFSLTQEVKKMPQGYYRLSWPVIYQPCDLTKMEGLDPVLAEIEANGFSAKSKHILAGATETALNGEEEGFIALTLPQSDKALAKSMKNLSYQSDITFQVKEDSVISIGVHKSHGTLDSEMTAVGSPTLTYYGAGLPYGLVAFDNDSIYAAGDTIKAMVGLHDGVGKKVPEDNVIDLMLCKKMENGEFDTDHPIISKNVKAPREDKYDLSIELPEGTNKLPDGNYILIVASLKDEKDYLFVEGKRFEINAAAAINEVIAEPTAITAKGNADKNTYNLAGMKVSNSHQDKGIYIKGKKKVARR